MPHVGNWLREAFSDAVHGWPESLANVDPGFYDDDRQQRWDQATVPVRARWLTGWLWHCSDIMPSSLCADLDLTPGSTYANGARRLRDQPVATWRDLRR